jgi:hypothetical protein
VVLECDSSTTSSQYKICHASTRIVTPAAMARTKNQIVANHTRLLPPSLQMLPEAERSEVSSSSETSSSEGSSSSSSSTESSSDSEDVSILF